MVGRGEAGPDDPQYGAPGDSVSIYQPNGSTTHTTKQSGANSQILSTPSTNKTTALYFLHLKFPPLVKERRSVFNLHLKYKKMEKDSFKNLPFGPKRDARAKKGVYDAIVFAGDKAGCCRPGRRLVQ